MLLVLAAAASVATAASAGTLCSSKDLASESLSYFGSDQASEDAAGDAVSSLVGYYSCLAFASEDAGRCASLKALRNFRPTKWYGDGKLPAWDVSCIGHYYEIRLARAMIGGDSGFEAVCVPALQETSRYESEDIKGSDVPKACSIMAGASSGVDRACAELGPLFIREEARRRCPQLLRRLTGDGSVCGKFQNKAAALRCRDYAAFRGARSKGEKSCGASGLCRAMLSRDPAACEGYLEALRDTVCRHGL